MSHNSEPITIPHQPGKLDFQIVEKEVSVTQFRRKPSAVWAYLETAGHVIVFTRRGKRDCAIMSIETYACMSGDYEKTMREAEEAAAKWRAERKTPRPRQRRRISMIPAEVGRCLKAVDAPSLFTQENQEAVHKHIRQVIEQGTDTVTISIDADLLAKVEETLKGYGWVRPDRV